MLISGEHRRNGWTPWHVFGALALVALGAGLTRAAWLSIWQITQNDAESSHIYLVAIAFPWLVKDRKELFARCRPRGQWLGAIMILLGGALHLYGYDYEYDVLWHGGALVVVVGALVTCVGAEVLWRFWPAFLVLGFLLPVPGRLRGEISIPLQTMMATITEQVSQVMGIGVNREGNVLVVNGKSVAIAEACNGMRMVFALFLVSYTFAFVNPLRRWMRVLILLMAPVFALVCNVIRMVPTVWFYGNASEGFAELFHDWAGWMMIFLGLIFLMGMIRVLEWAGLPVNLPQARRRGESEAPRIDEDAADEGVAGEAGVVGVAGVVWRRPGYALGMVGLSILLLVGLGYELEPRRMPSGLAQYHASIHDASEDLPAIIGEWYGKDVPVPAEAIDTLRPNVMFSRRYSNLRTGSQVTIMLVHCSDARSIENHYPAHCYPMSGWTIQSTNRQVWRIDGWDVHLTEYDFVKSHVEGDERITVTNFMVLPTGSFEPDMESVQAFARSPYKRHYGAGQTQLVFTGSTTLEQRKQMLETFMIANRPIYETILKGAQI